MPRIPTDYSKALIYKIVCKDIKIKECYYGSTTNFKARKWQHKNCCNNINSKDYNQFKYQFIRENGGWNNWEMILVKYYTCNNKLELEREERMCMENDENRLNDYLPSRTSDEKKQYEKKYREENREVLNEKAKIYYEENPEYKKKYYEENKEVLIEQAKKYCEDNKAKLYKICDCKCGRKYQYRSKSRHFKTNIHQKYIKNN